MKHLVAITALLVWATLIMCATWTGATSINWDTASNWSSGTVPTLTTDVVIPAGTVRSPQVIWATGNCRDLILQTGATLTISGAFTLNVRHMTMFGSLVMNSSGPIVSTGNISWETGSTASISSTNPRINVQGNMAFQSGSIIQMAYGIIQFNGSTSANLTNYSSATQIYAIETYKTYPASLTISSSTTQPFTLNSNIYNYAGSTLINNYTGTLTLKGSLTDNNLSSDNGKIMFNSGTLKLDGANPALSLKNPNCYLQDVVFSQTGTAQLAWPLTCKGNLIIESGVFFPQTHTVNVAGNWSNQVGPSAFTEGSARVVFNGSGHQYCNYTENFNILEVNKSGGALRVDSSTAVVTCASYDWTAGAIDILSGTFTANDLADNGLFGDYYCTYPGVMNLTNNDGYVDLAGNITVTGEDFHYGKLNIYGGTTDSYWPYSRNASLTLHYGVITFHDTGIHIEAPGTLTFTANISFEGIIQTTGDFSCYNSNFTPTEGRVRLIGSADAEVDMSAGTLNSLYIRKETRDADEAALSNQLVRRTDKNGDYREVYRTNTVKLMSDITVDGELNLSEGTLWLNGHEMDTVYFTAWSGTLKMNSTSDRFIARVTAHFEANCSTDITQGIIEIYAYSFEIMANSSIIIPITVPIYCRAPGLATIKFDNANHQLGNVFFDRSGVASDYHLSRNFPEDEFTLNILGNLSITAGNSLTLANVPYLHIAVAGNLDLDGTLIIDGMDLNIQGKPDFASTSTLTVIDGSFNYFSSTVPRTTDLRGILNLDNGIFNAENNGLLINAGSTNTITGSGSQIICDGITANQAGTFQPAEGTVIFTSNLASGNPLLTVSNGNWLPNVTINTSTGFLLDSNLIIKGYLKIQAGYLDVSSSNYSITISGQWLNQVGINGFVERGGRVIFNGSESQNCSTETFNILEINKSGGYFWMTSPSTVVTCAKYDWTAGGLEVANGTFTANDLADSGIFGTYYVHNSATLNLSNYDSWVDLNGFLSISDNGTVNVFSNYQSDWSFGGNATLNMSGGTLDFKNRGIRIYNSPTYTFSSTISGGTIRTVGGFEVNRTGFNPTGGIIELYGSTDASLTMTYGHLVDLVINKTDSREERTQTQTQLISIDKEANSRELTRSNTITLGNNVDLNGNLTIQAGVLNASNLTINIAGNWNNIVGDSGFLEGQSTVIFDGLGIQYLYSNEKFYNLTLAKAGTPTELGQLDGRDVYVANNMLLSQGYYRAGYNCKTYVNNLSIASLASFRTYSELFVSGNMYDYNTTYGESVGYVISGIIAFNGTGSQTISRSGVEFRANSITIDKPVGTICYFANPVKLSFSLTILSGIMQDLGSNFVHQLGANLNVWAIGAIANNTNNTFTFVGDMYQNIFYTGTGGLTNIIINKSAASRSMDLEVAMESEADNRTVDVTISAPLVLSNSGNISIENGYLDSAGYDITCPGNLNINSSNAALYMQPGSSLRMGSAKSLNVNAGSLYLTGSLADPVTVTSISGNYNFNVESGANISATYTIFEKMTATGVNIKSGAVVNTTDPFKGCTFQSGISGGTLLTLNSNQTLNIDNAVFPANTWSGAKNVQKTLNWGTVNFNMASGDFSGAAFESDTYNRINWLGGSPDLRITSIDWSSNNPYICDPITATVHVQNNSTTNITTPFRVDVYKNRSTVPPVGTLGDSYITISSLAAGVTTNVTFTNLSTDIPGTWTSWFQVDANNQITETNESNNVWTPAITTTWNALPVASNLQAVRSGNNIQLSWDYPLSVYRYKIYKDISPNGSFSTLAGTSFTPSFSQTPSENMWFYRVQAERNLP